MITYEYIFINLKKEDIVELTDVIREVFWQLKGTEGDNFVSVPFTTKLDLPEIESFIDFENVTEEHLTLWVSEKVDVEFIKQNISETLVNLL